MRIIHEVKIIFHSRTSTTRGGGSECIKGYVVRWRGEEKEGSTTIWFGMQQ